MNVRIHQTEALANAAAAELLSEWITAPEVRNVMLAAGNSPLALYGLVAERRLPLSHLNVFALDEYVGVPPEEPRNCANLLRRQVAGAWGVPATQYHTISSLPEEALGSIQRHERLIEQAGGLDVAVLGVGQNGHLGFNEPGSARDSGARVIELETISIEANRKWFGGDYAPAAGATLGLKTILAARRILVLAYGGHKAAAVKQMLGGAVGSHCPASFVREHPEAWAFLDEPAAAGVKRTTGT
jgi:glucosamine-6-phosphate deaminase